MHNERSKMNGNNSRYSNRGSGNFQRSSQTRPRRKKRRLRPWVKIALLVIAALILILFFKKIFGKSGKESSKESTKPVSTGTPTPMQQASNNTPTEAATPTPVVPSGPKYTICVDAGHGFADGGTSSEYLGAGVNEREITLDMAKLLKAELEARGHQVVLTHDGENQPKESEIMQKATELGVSYNASYFTENKVFHAYERTIWANVLNKQYNFDVMISLHVNALDDASVSGYQVYFCSTNDYSAKSEVISKKLVEAMKTDFPGKNVSTYARNNSNAFYVTKYPTMPSLLLEMGFCTNKDDAADMMNDEWRAKYVKTIADGLEQGLA